MAIVLSETVLVIERGRGGRFEYEYEYEYEKKPLSPSFLRGEGRERLRK